MTKPNICDLSFVCQKKWEELDVTIDAPFRFCETCKKAVFAIQTRQELAIASAVGRCVAVKTDNQVFGWIGEPEGSLDWMEEESKVVKVRTNTPIPDSTFERFRLAFPRAVDSTAEWHHQDWLAIGKFTPYVSQILVKEFSSMFPEFEICVEDL